MAKLDCFRFWPHSKMLDSRHSQRLVHQVLACRHDSQEAGLQSWGSSALNRHLIEDDSRAMYHSIVRPAGKPTCAPLAQVLSPGSECGRDGQNSLEKHW